MAPFGVRIGLAVKSILSPLQIECVGAFEEVNDMVGFDKNVTVTLDTSVQPKLFVTVTV